MCGLVGLIDFKNHSKDYMYDIKNMLAKTNHLCVETLFVRIEDLWQSICLI